MSIEEELQEAAETGSLVIGAEETLKEMDGLDAVVLASNVPPETEQAVVEAAEEDVEVYRAEADNRQLGSLCGEPFAASVVGMK